MTPELTPNRPETGPGGDPIARLKAGLVQQSAFGEPMVAWNDGYTQYGAVDHGEAAP